MSDSRYEPLSKSAYRAWAVVRALPPIAWLALLWVAAYDDKYRPSQGVAIATFAALIAYYIWLRIRRNLRSSRVAQRHAATAKLLGAGDLESAAKTIDETLDDARATPPVHCILLVQRAQLFLRLGDADRSLSLLKAIVATHWLDDARLAQGASSLASALAMTELARGDLGEAERWQKEAHAKIKEAERVQLLPLDTLVDARCGRYAEAIERIDEALAGAEETLAPRAVDLLKLLRAFAAEQLGKPAEATKDLDADVDYLVKDWPELRAFVAKNALAAVT